VEGIIGAGKSHCLSHLSNYETIEIQKEPVESWQNWDGTNLLDLFYRDPYAYGYMFQNYVQLTMFERHLKPPQNNIRIMERSIFSAHHVFQRNLAEKMEIDDWEDKMLTSWFNLLTAYDREPVCRMHLDLVVYIKVDPSIALDRIKTRGRLEERFINLDYLQHLDLYHQQWLDSITNTEDPGDCKVLILDGNKPKDQMYEEYNKIIDCIMTMLN
jgi:deoxyadenosine/deoxycytidine kinase